MVTSWEGLTVRVQRSGSRAPAGLESLSVVGTSCPCGDEDTCGVPGETIHLAPVRLTAMPHQEAACPKGR